MTTKTTTTATTKTTTKRTQDPEITAINQVIRTLSTLDTETRRRVLWYVAKREEDTLQKERLAEMNRFKDQTPVGSTSLGPSNGRMSEGHA